MKGNKRLQKITRKLRKRPLNMGERSGLHKAAAVLVFDTLHHDGPAVPLWVGKQPCNTSSLCQYLECFICKCFQNNFYWRHRGAGYMLLLYGLVCTFGALANLLVLVAFLRTPHLRNLRNYFIANLAVSDLLMCIVTAPVTLYLTLNLFWPFGNFACQTVCFEYFFSLRMWSKTCL